MPISVSDPYANVLQYRSQVDKSDAGSDADVEQDLLAVSRWLDKKLRRFFTVDTVDATRVYRPGCYARTLQIDDLAAAPVSITVDLLNVGSFVGLTPLAATDYELWPLNATLGPEPQPYTAIYIPSYNLTLGGFTIDQRVEIVGRWGWPAVPMALQRGTIELTAIWRLESPRSTNRVTELGDTFSTSRIAQSLVMDLVKQYGKVGALVV